MDANKNLLDLLKVSPEVAEKLNAGEIPATEVYDLIKKELYLIFENDSAYQQQIKAQAETDAKKGFNKVLREVFKDQYSKLTDEEKAKREYEILARIKAIITEDLQSQYSKITDENAQARISELQKVNANLHDAVKQLKEVEIPAAEAKANLAILEYKTKDALAKQVLSKLNLRVSADLFIDKIFDAAKLSGYDIHYDEGKNTLDLYQAGKHPLKPLVRMNNGSEGVLEIEAFAENVIKSYNGLNQSTVPDNPQNNQTKQNTINSIAVNSNNTSTSQKLTPAQQHAKDMETRRQQAQNGQ